MGSGSSNRLRSWSFERRRVDQYIFTLGSTIHINFIHAAQSMETVAPAIESSQKTITSSNSVLQKASKAKYQNSKK